MDTPQTTPELLQQLQATQQRVTALIQAASAEQFFRGTAAAWSAADYLKHLLIAVKPLAKVMRQPPSAILAQFGPADHPSRTYAEVESYYQTRLAEGVRAEDYQGILPEVYRFPAGVQDQHAHLVEAWQEANQRLIAAVQGWSEADLDGGQLPHLALGMLTVREMLCFTLIHNRLHAADIEKALRA